MERFLTTLLFCILLSSIFAQSGQFTSKDESDPEAKAILDKVREKHQSYASLEAHFSLELEFPEQEKEIQKGVIAQQGDKYRLKLSSQTIISDGTSLWLILDNNKEVQINDVPEEDDEYNIFTPQSIFSFYEKGNFVYILANEFAEKGRVIQQIEFKPLDDDIEYFKLRLTVDKKTKNVVRLKTFGKDGSRFTLHMDKLTPNKTFAANHFTFNQSEFQGYHVEDLRY